MESVQQVRPEFQHSDCMIERKDTGYGVEDAAFSASRGFEGLKARKGSPIRVEVSRVKSICRICLPRK